MRFGPSIVSAILAGFAAASPNYALESRANPKSNQFPNPNCKDDKGGNQETWHHQKLCGCVTMDASSSSVYLATSPSQKIQAFEGGTCNPGADGSQHLGEIGGGCVEDLDTQFDEGRIGSLFFYVPVICSIWDKLKDTLDGFEEDEAEELGKILGFL